MALTGCVIATALRAPAEEPVAAESTAPVVLAPFKVEETLDAKLSFGMSLDVWANKETHRVIAVYVREVQPDSSADYAGIKSRTRIYSFDYLPVESFEATYKQGSDLRRLLVDRKPGDQLVVVFGAHGQEKTAVLTQGRGAPIIRWGDDERSRKRQIEETLERKRTL